MVETILDKYAELAGFTNRKKEPIERFKELVDYKYDSEESPTDSEDNNE
jgi:hypothetical protein